jgi:hyperosmotically inducible protein
MSSGVALRIDINDMRNVIGIISLTTAIVVICCTLAASEHAPVLSQYDAVSVERQSSFGLSPLELAIRESLRPLPYYGVFDHLAYRVEGDIVVLFGEVMRPELIHDAQRVVKETIEPGRVHNMIRLLTVSPAEDEIRKGVFTAIYGDSAFRPYTLATGGAIHIVVEGKRVTLYGEVSSHDDHQLAAIRASHVQGVHEVVNHLTVSR